MAAPTVFNSIATNPGGTGSTITVTLSTHAVDDVLLIYIANTGNSLWTGNPAGWNRLDQRAVGSSGNGIIGTWFWRRVASGDSLPLTDPTFTLGSTSTRAAVCRTIRGADLEGVFSLPEWGQRGFSTGTSNPVRPPTVTTLAPEMLILHCYASRSATNAPEPTSYIQDQEVVISGTLALNASQRTVSDQDTSLANQDASPTSGARWAAGILCIPSPDYAYYRSGSQALNAAGTSATPALPTGTSSSDWRTNKDLIIATIECAGTPTIAPNTPADWTQIAGEWATTTSGNGTTVRKYWALYDGSLDRQFNRSTSGEIFVYFSAYRNTHQTSPIGQIEAQQNASAGSSAFPALVRTAAKSTIQATCIADATPTYTAPSGWIERNDSQGVTCADQVFNTTGTTSSASFTLSSASPTACGVIEILSIPPPITTFERSAAIAATGGLATVAQFFTIFERSGSVSATANITSSAQFFSVFERAVSIDAIGEIVATPQRELLRSTTISVTADIAIVAIFFSILERTLELAATAEIASSGEAFTVIERAASVGTTATISVNGLQLPPLSFPNAPILDDFNRANQGPPPSANWTTGVGALVGLLTQGHRVSSNALIRAVGDSESESYWSAAQFGPDSECYLTLVSTSGFIALSLGVRIANIGSGTTDGYVCLIDSSQHFIYRVENGSATVLATGNTNIVSAGSKYGLQAIGNVIRLWRDNGSGWTQVLSADDATFNNAGFLAIYTASTTATTFDDFGGGSIGATEVERAASFDAAASIGSSGFAILERAGDLSVTASVTVAGERVVDRAVAVNASAEIATVAKSFTIHSASAALDVAASIEASAESFSVVEQSTALDATVALDAAGVRVVDRSLSIATTVAIESSAESFSVVEGAVQVATSAAITASAQFFSILERQADLASTATVSVGSQTEQVRAVAISAVAAISVSGIVVPPEAVEHERSASLDVAVEIAAAAQFYSILVSTTSVSATATIATAGVATIPRLVMVEAAGTISVSYQRELQRSATFNSVGEISASAYTGGIVERAASLTATITLTVSGQIATPTPARRTFMVSSEQRTIAVQSERRAFRTSRESRQQQT